jgi:nudix-type nucleoside diphosphatase (YffH/AdpP family)
VHKDDHPRNVEIERREIVFNDFFQIEEAYLRREQFDGTMSETVRRLSFERGDGVAALVANTDAQTVLLVEQFRYPTLKNGDGWVIEVIAGMLEPDEAPEACIRREILEETGYRAGRLRHISTFYTSPGGTSERIFLYYGEVTDAEKVAEGGGAASEDEDIRVLEMPLAEAWDALTAGRFQDAKTLIALMWLRDNLRR